LNDKPLIESEFCVDDISSTNSDRENQDGSPDNKHGKSKLSITSSTMQYS
jgi:hypothetical protein